MSSKHKLLIVMDEMGEIVFDDRKIHTVTVLNYGGSIVTTNTELRTLVVPTITHEGLIATPFIHKEWPKTGVNYIVFVSDKSRIGFANIK